MTAIRWRNGRGGNWGQGRNWSGGVAPGATDDASIAGAFAGEIDIFKPASIHNVSLDARAGTLAVGAVFRIGGTFTIQAGQLQLDAGGVIQGGVIADTASGLLGLGGTLSAITFQGTLAAPQSLCIDHGITLAGKGGVGTATLDLNGPNCEITYIGSGTLDNATLLLGENVPGAGGYLLAEDLAGHGSTLILGPHFTVRQAGLYGDIIGSTNGTIVNDGLITAGTAGGTLDVQGNNFINAGQINVSNGDTLTTSFATFRNSGKIGVGSGGTLVLDSAAPSSTVTLAPGSVLLAGGGTLDLDYVTTGATLAAISNPGGTINIQGVINNAGTIANHSAGGVLQLDGGTIMGGTLIDTGPSILLTGGILSDVAIRGTLDVTGTALTLEDGVSFAGLGEAAEGFIDISSPNTSCTYLYGGVMDDVVMSLGSDTGSYFEHDDPNGVGTKLTFGSASRIIQSGAFATLFTGNATSDSIGNEGTITASVADGSFTIGGNDFSSSGLLSVGNADNLVITTTTFTNTGRVVDAGGTVTLETTLDSASLIPFIAGGGAVALAGTLINTGSIALGGQQGTLSAEGTIIGGTLAVAGGGLVNQGEILNDVAYQGTLNLSQLRAGVVLEGGTSLSGIGGTGNATILLGSFADLVYTGTGTLDHATAYINDAYNAMDYDGISAVNSDPTGAVLTLGSHFHVVQTGLFAGLHADDFAGDGIVNDGAVTAAHAGGTFFIDGASFTNAGTIAVSNGDTLAVTNTIFINTGHLSANAGGADQAGTSVLFQGPITNTGTIIAAAGTTSFSDSVGGGGQLQIGAAGTLALLAGDAAAQTVDFLAGTGLLSVQNPSVLDGSIAHFGAADRIDLAFTVSNGFTYVNNTLTVFEAGQTVAALHFTGAYTQADFMVTTDNVGGTAITFI